MRILLISENHAKVFDNNLNLGEQKFKSIFLNRLTWNPQKIVTNSDKTLCEELLLNLNDNCFDGLKEKEEFVAIKKRLENFWFSINQVSGIYTILSKAFKRNGRINGTGNGLYKLQGCLKDIFAFSISKVYDKQDAEDGAKTHNKVYASGINLSPDIARDQMVMTKLQFGKTDKILAYHGYQSFLPGEVI